MNQMKLDKAPIVEVVVDIDCDMPPSFLIEHVDPASIAMHKEYPIIRKNYELTHEIKQKIGEEPVLSATQPIVQALRFLHADEKQLVQVRNSGFSFNRLAPYTSLDNYLEEIRRTWNLFANAFEPVRIKQIRLRYINRFDLPLTNGNVELSDYLTVAPSLPDENPMLLNGFVNQSLTTDKESGNSARIILASHPSKLDVLTLVLDIGVFGCNTGNIQWDFIHEELIALRDLKNRIFFSMLKDKCTTLFQNR